MKKRKKPKKRKSVARVLLKNPLNITKQDIDFVLREYRKPRR